MSPHDRSGRLRFRSDQRDRLSWRGLPHLPSRGGTTSAAPSPPQHRRRSPARLPHRPLFLHVVGLTAAPRSSRDLGRRLDLDIISTRESARPALTCSVRSFSLHLNTIDAAASSTARSVGRSYGTARATDARTGLGIRRSLPVERVARLAAANAPPDSAHYREVGSSRLSHRKPRDRRYPRCPPVMELVDASGPTLFSPAMTSSRPR